MMCGCAWAMALMVSATAGAQQYPIKPVRWLSPFAAGGGVDVTTHAVAQRLAEHFGQPFVVENRSGASGKIAVDLAARAAPDGYTLITITPSMVSNQAIGDFSPISQMIGQGYVVVVHPSVPAKSIQELIALARAKPGRLHYGSSGPNTMQHLGGALLGAMTHTEIVHVPYKGGAQALIDVLGGQIEFMLGAMGTAAPHIKTGKVRGLAVTSSRRSSILPDLPTVAEAGVPGYAVDNWYGVAAPPKTPAAVVSRLNAEIARVMKLPEVRARVTQDGAEPVGNTVDEFKLVIAETIARWRRAEKAAGIKSAS